MSALSADLLRVSRQLLLQAVAAGTVRAAQLLLRQLLLQTLAAGSVRAAQLLLRQLLPQAAPVRQGDLLSLVSLRLRDESQRLRRYWRQVVREVGV